LLEAPKTILSDKVDTPVTPNVFDKVVAPVTPNVPPTVVLPLIVALSTLIDVGNTVVI